ncbi:MAG: hypothetical protein ACK4GW_10365 [Pseudorhodobacter sp.]
MKRRDVLIRLPLTEPEAAKFKGRWAMVVPLSEAEAAELRDKINLSQDTICKLAQALSTLHEVLETRGAGEADIRKTLAMWMEPARATEAMLDRCRELLGRAVFVGGAEDGESVQ